MVRTLVTSATYRQASAASPALVEKDPYNRLYARQSRFRLDAEMVRDNALAVSGLLSPRMGGPSAHPYQPLGYWAYLNFPPREWDDSPGDDQYRRGLYTWWQRAFPQPSLVAFDAPSREECVADRVRSNVPQQALALLNDPTYVEAARVFAARILRQGGTTTEARLRWAYARALSRPPNADEVRVLTSLLGRRGRSLRAGRRGRGASWPPARLRWRRTSRGGARRLDPGRPGHPEPARAHHPLVNEGRHGDPDRRPPGAPRAPHPPRLPRPLGSGPGLR